MRWTNYFIHPGDNRYYVFSFKKVNHKEMFEKALIAENIPFEDFEDDELEYGAKYLFGIPRTHINEAMRVNNLLHASIRGPFIKSKTLRELDKNQLQLYTRFVMRSLLGEKKD